jgi:hypothetical protein
MACVDEHTQLPDGLIKPPPCPPHPYGCGIDIDQVASAR